MKYVIIMHHGNIRHQQKTSLLSLKYQFTDTLEIFAFCQGDQIEIFVGKILLLQLLYYMEYTKSLKVPAKKRNVQNYSTFTVSCIACITDSPVTMCIILVYMT